VALVAMTCVGLGIAVAATTFSLADGIVFRSLPFPDPGRFVNLGVAQADEPDDARLSYPDFRDWREQASVFTEMAGVSLRTVTVADGRDAALLRAGLVTWNLLPMTGEQPALGRAFLASDDTPGAEPVVILSDDVWRQRFAADPGVLGRPVTIDGRVHTVVGVMPQRFGFPFTQQLWMPLESGLRARTRSDRLILTFARLRPDVTLDQATSQVAGIAARLASLDKENAGWNARVRTLRQMYNPPGIAFTILLMLAAGVCVLLIACANLANVMLARAIGRQGEMALRFAMGANRLQVVRLVLAEAVLLAVIGLPAGLALTRLGLWWFDREIAQSSSNVPYTLTWGLDARVVLFAVLATVGAGIVAGLGAALRASRGQPQQMLVGGSAGSGGGAHRNRLRSALVVAEVAVSLLLLAGAGLFFRSFVRSARDTGGVNVDRVMTMRVWMPDATHPEAADMTRRVDEILTRIEGLPGVGVASASGLIPLDGDSQVGTLVQERGAVAAGDELRVRYSGVTAGFFAAVDVRALRGRLFTRQEAIERSGVVVVNDTFAARVWPSEDAVGRTFRFADAAGGEPLRVIGVVPSFNNDGLVPERRPVPAAYLPFPYEPARNARLMIRTTGDPTAIVPEVRNLLRGLDANMPITNVRSMETLRRDETWAFSFTASIFGLLGGVALVLGGLGVFGVLAYAVSQRTYEIGVRMAIGASGGQVARMFVGHGAWLCGAGIALGLALTLLIAPFIERGLYQTSGRDPLTLGALSLFLFGIGLVASYVPARRAARLDPARTLRST
jgi:predicted permease